MKNKGRIITNQEKILNDINSTIKDLKIFRKNPNIASNKKKIIRHGLKIYTSKSPICLTNKEGLKLCQIDPLNCILSLNKQFGCRNLVIYAERKKRNKLPFIESSIEFYRLLKIYVKSLKKEELHKKKNLRENIYNTVKDINKIIHKDN